MTNMTKKLYLAGPINGRSDADAKDWRALATSLWRGDVFDPMVRDYRGREGEPGIAEEIVRGDLRAIAASDAMIVYFDKPSVGTAMEVFFAHTTLQLPVAIVNVSERPLSPWLQMHARAAFTDLSAAIDYLWLRAGQ